MCRNLLVKHSNYWCLNSVFHGVFTQKETSTATWVSVVAPALIKLVLSLTCVSIIFTGVKSMQLPITTFHCALSLYFWSLYYYCVQACELYSQTTFCNILYNNTGAQFLGNHWIICSIHLSKLMCRTEKNNV